MEITTKTTKRGRISIYADGEFMFAVPADVWYSSKYKDGCDMNSEELSELKAQGNSFLCFESAMRMLSLRAHSEYELKRKLTAKFDRSSAEYAIDKLKGLGLINDKKFAQLLADELMRRKSFAKRRIVSELISRGIDKNTAEETVNMLEFPEESGIIKLIDKMNITSESTPKEKQRAVRRLMNMGYSYGEITKYISFGDE